LIVFDDVTKYQRGRGASQLVLSGVSATFHRGQNPAILCDRTARSARWRACSSAPTIRTAER
jgi:hypothetical protein